MLRFALLFLYQAILLLARPQANDSLDEDRVSELGWTDAHHVAYGWPLGGTKTTVPPERAVEFLSSASDEFLCRRNDFGQTALHLAVREDRLELVQMYADRRLCLDVPNHDGDTPLHYAAAWGRYDAAKVLMQAGANARARNKQGGLPIDDARSRKFPQLISLLQESLETCEAV